MRNRQHSSLLTTLVLVAATSFALGSEALASSKSKSSNSTSSWLAGKASKPGATPMVGEPDAPGNLPLPPKIGPYSTGGSSLADWTLRIHWTFRYLLLQTPKRFP